jgi:hypothetical protein
VRFEPRTEVNQCVALSFPVFDVTDILAGDSFSMLLLPPPLEPVGLDQVGVSR